MAADLHAAAMLALRIDRDKCRAYGAKQTVRSSAEHLLEIAKTTCGFDPSLIEQRSFSNQNNRDLLQKIGSA
jgi:hypothetical protein